MIKELRHSAILKYLKDRDVVVIEDISIQLDIPLTTLRRDLIELMNEGKIIKLHGGAKLPKNNFVDEDYLENKLKINVEAKQAIAQQALQKIKNNSTIFLDAGSNVYYLAKILDPKANLTIVTNSILNIQELAHLGHQKIYLLGGKFTNVTGAILGYEAIEAMQNYFFDMSFIGINAVDDEGNIYTTSSEHAQIKMEIIKHSSQTFGLVDESKLHSKSFYRFASIDEVELIS